MPDNKHQRFTLGSFHKALREEHKWDPRKCTGHAHCHNSSKSKGTLHDIGFDLQATPPPTASGSMHLCRDLFGASLTPSYSFLSHRQTVANMSIMCSDQQWANRKIHASILSTPSEKRLYTKRD